MTNQHPFWSIIFLLLLSFLSCESQQDTTEPDEGARIARQEAREDSLELVAAYARQAEIQQSVPAALETGAVVAKASKDAADDPAIWVNPIDPQQSIIIGSNKKGGLHLYDLTGKELAYFPVGKINNVDVLNSFQLGDRAIVLVGGSNRSDQSIDLFMLDPTGPVLVDISADALKVDSTEIDDVYGFCFYQGPNHSYAFINGKNGMVQQFELTATDNGKIAATKVRSIPFDSQVEGMVADREYGVLYVGEEDAGIWKLSAAADGGTEKTLVSMSSEENPNISYDVEGLTLYEQGDEGYLIASSQGNFSYAIFSRTDSNAYLTSFFITENGEVDGVEETDGIQAVSAPLGADFPMGIFLAQDGFNYAGDSLQPQNFKVVDWRTIDALLQAK